ncbi:MAG: DegV family protein [Bacillota bacterium]
MRVRIVTDSTSSIPMEIRQALDITVVPSPIMFGSFSFKDGEIPMSEFYERLRSSPTPPNTSTPSPAEFLEAYTALLREAEAVISIHMMGTKTTIPRVARMAAEMAPSGRVHVIDSQSTTLGLGLLVMQAARAAQSGASVAEILRLVEGLIPGIQIHVAVREMTQLRRSGRVSLGQALLANALSIKPVIRAAGSAIEVVEKARGFHHALDRVVSLAQEAAGEAPVDLAVIHSNTPAEGQQLLDRVRSLFNCREAIVAELGANLAAHVGPGALGIATMRLPQ